MEHIYNFKGKRMTLNEFKEDIINDYINTKKTKKELHKIYPVSTVILSKVLKDVKKEYCECLKCGNETTDDFYPSNKSLCKICISSANKKGYKNLSENEKTVKINKQKNWINNNIIKVRVLAAKHRAIRKKITFDIDDEFINELFEKQNGLCKYSGVLLDITNTGSNENQMNINSLSIDRIDSSKGYTKDNVVLVTAIVNNMKNDLTENEFLKTITKICETTILKKMSEKI
jgi:hypothetical protein